MVESRTPEERLAAIGIAPEKVKNLVKNKKVCDKFMEVLNLAEVTECPKEKGALFEAVTTKMKPSHAPYTKLFAKMVADGKWLKNQQLDEGIKWLDLNLKKHGEGYKIDDAEFAEATGVGVVVTQEEVDAAVNAEFDANAAALKEEGHDFDFSKILRKLREEMKWADGAAVNDTIKAKRIALLGDIPENDGKRKKKGKAPKEPKAAADGKAEEKKPAKGVSEFEKEEEGSFDIEKLIPRDMDAGNTPEILAKHRAVTGGKVHTRFPPEPNGYLHIGHAKSIRFNFTIAKEYGGNTYLRFDDTNPCKENQEYIDHIKGIVSWLGYEPFKTTASSDYFQELYEIAVRLIKKDKAYVCF